MSLYYPEESGGRHFPPICHIFTVTLVYSDLLHWTYLLQYICESYSLQWSRRWTIRRDVISKLLFGRWMSGYWGNICIKLIILISRISFHKLSIHLYKWLKRREMALDDQTVWAQESTLGLAGWLAGFCKTSTSLHLHAVCRGPDSWRRQKIGICQLRCKSVFVHLLEVRTIQPRKALVVVIKHFDRIGGL